MPNASERFPRAKLFSQAAQFQSDIEYWLGKTAISHEFAEQQGLEIPAGKLAARYDKLEEARRLVTELRKTLYDTV